MRNFMSERKLWACIYDTQAISYRKLSYYSAWLKDSLVCSIFSFMQFLYTCGLVNVFLAYCCIAL